MILIVRLIKLLVILQLFLSCSETTIVESAEPQTPEDLIAHSKEFQTAHAVLAEMEANGGGVPIGTLDAMSSGEVADVSGDRDR